MSYLAAADFRAASLAEYCAGLELTDEEASEPRLTPAIARLSRRFDELTRDHFEEEAGLVLELAGSGTDRLYLPKRCTAVTAVKTRDEAGVLTAESASVYRLIASLESAGTRRRDRGAIDYLELVPGGDYLTTGSVWPAGPQTVQITGDFGWKAVPADVKRAVALLVYDHFKPVADVLRRAVRVATADAQYTLEGVPLEAADIAADYRRPELEVA